MYPLPGPPGPDEPTPYEPQVPTASFSREAFIRFLWISTLVYFVGVTMRIWSEDEARLHILYQITKVLQSIAHLIGSMALKTEARYHDHVDHLH